jgi:2-methylcitrate dehydratase PrpD
MTNARHCRKSVLWVFERIKEGRMTKRFLAGKAAQSGLMAADLANPRAHWTSTVVEGEWGYLKAPQRSGGFSRLRKTSEEATGLWKPLSNPIRAAKASMLQLTEC